MGSGGDACHHYVTCFQKSTYANHAAAGLPRRDARWLNGLGEEPEMSHLPVSFRLAGCGAYSTEPW